MVLQKPNESATTFWPGFGANRFERCSGSSSHATQLGQRGRGVEGETRQTDQEILEGADIGGIGLHEVLQEVAVLAARVGDALRLGLRCERGRQRSVAAGGGCACEPLQCSGAVS